MGTRDAGSFQNETALDWAGDLCESGNIEVVRALLSRVMEQRMARQAPVIGRLLGRRRAVSPARLPAPRH